MSMLLALDKYTELKFPGSLIINNYRNPIRFLSL